MKRYASEYIEIMTHSGEHEPFLLELFGPLVGLEEEWRSQGASEDEINLTAFDFDYLETFFLGNMLPLVEKEKLVEETNEYKITIDGLGRTMKLIKSAASIPVPLNYPVKNMDDWLKVKHMFEFNESRITNRQIEQAKQIQKRGGLIIAEIPGGFDVVRELMGEENVCLGYYMQAELINDIVSTVSDTTYKVLEYASKYITIDNLYVHEDMAGKSGPLIGPSTIEEFIKPYYLRNWNMLQERGTKLFSQDSDGNMEAVLDIFIESGINLFYPCEPAAGMDIVSLKKKYGNKIALKGGIDKHVLRQSKDEILKELEYKMQSFMQKGGVAFGLDHRIPNGTPLENYRYYVKTAKKLLNKKTDPSNVSNYGWNRMAF